MTAKRATPAVDDGVTWEEPSPQAYPSKYNQYGKIREACQANPGRWALLPRTFDYHPSSVYSWWKRQGFETAARRGADRTWIMYVRWPTENGATT